MSELLETLRQEGVDPALLSAVEEYRAAHPLDAALRPRIPAPAFTYYGKEVWEQALAALLCGENLLLAGGKATGKNVLAENLSAVFGRPAWDISFHVNMDAASLIGMDTFADGRVEFRPGPVYRCAQCGGFGVLDEINMAKNEALAVLHAVLDFRRAIDVPGYDRIPLAEETRFIATMNYGYAGTRELNEALTSRFVVIQMPTITQDNLEKLLRAQFPDLAAKYAHQFALLFLDLQKKCDSAEISTKALDLRGMLDALRLIRRGIPAGAALDMGITNKAFDSYEQGLIRWAAAGAYGFEPLFLAHNTDGTVDFYMNTIVGLVHKYYGDKLINSIFDRWAGDLRQAMLDDLAWLYLENAAYRLELPRRPVLEALRYSHADYFFAIQYKLSRQEWMARNQLVYTMQAARWRSVLGRSLPVMTPYESGLFRALAPDTAPQPDQLQDALLAVYATFGLFDGTVHPKAALHLHLDGLLATLATKALPTQMIKTDRVTVEHSNAVDAAGSGPSVDKRQAHITLKQNAAQDRAYIESCFGRSLYPPERLRKAEQELCTGVHLGCHLWFSAGVPSPEQAPTPEARHLAEQAELQADRNRAYYAKNQELHRSVVLRLTEQIRNCILVHQQPNARVARSGNVDPGRVWRAPLLNDDRVFLCAEEENHPAFTVDLLLDASASRLHCQEVIAAQGSILAESLANCGIPVRVSAFSSLRGYTVLRVLKDFADKNRQNINRYFASGWNRDGLALLAAGDLLDFAPGPAPRHLLILLTDASPNDSRRIPPSPENPLGCGYEDAAGVADAAAQVRVLQRKGIRVSAVFMGEDRSAADAARIYGKNMARIRGMDQLARAAGRLIQNEIRELGD